MAVRIDKYLWSIRIFKTRNKATEAIKSGRVKIGEQVVKPSREVKTGETIQVKQNQLLKTIRAIKVIDKRVAAPKAGICYEDLTPLEEYDKQKTIKQKHFEIRVRGLGRPTKRDRRDIDRLKDYL